MVEPTMWGEFRQYLSERKAYREKNRWPVARRRAWLFFGVGMAVWIGLLVTVCILTIVVSLWFGVLLLPAFVAGWKYSKFLDWYGDKHNI